MAAESNELESKTRVDMHADTTQSNGNEDTFDEMTQAQRKGLFGKINARFQDKLQDGRGDDGIRDARQETAGHDSVTADDLAIRRAKSVNNPRRMIVPEGVIIEGSLTSGSETEIAGRVDGGVTVDGNLRLESSGLVTGNVRATNCTIEGLCEGNMECTQSLELGETGRLNADAMSGHKMILAGEVVGNVNCGGQLHLMASAKVTGNIRARSIVIEEGAIFNGSCSMATPKQAAATKK
jgi:cytoskeletal protein CcmA (bactofilin family)